jgi:hypothetical protein
MRLIHSGEDCFVNGTQFIPERWTTKPEMVLNSKAHIPFSIGKSILFSYPIRRNNDGSFSCNYYIHNVQVNITALDSL